MKFFTIVSKSYLGLAKVLYSSLINSGSISEKDKLFVFVLDYDESISINGLELINVELLFEADSTFISNSFKYDITEFSTSIKPRAFRYLFSNSKTRTITYLDPDIYVFKNISQSTIKNQFLIELTPHFLSLDLEKQDYNRYLGSGAFNLGFCRIHRGVKTFKFLEWWELVCNDGCYRERDEYLFTDQKWFDLIFCFFDKNELNIIRDFTYNVAPWNLHERKITLNDGVFLCEYDKKVAELSFFHFSGFNYKELHLMDSSNEKFELKLEQGTIKLLKFYSNSLSSEGVLNYLDLPYKFNFFQSGKGDITLFHRRVYRELLAAGLYNYNPFEDKKILSKYILSKNGPKVSSSLSDIKNNHSKMILIQFFFKLLLKFIGLNTYINFLKFIRHFSRFENQVFLIESKAKVNFK